MNGLGSTTTRVNDFDNRGAEFDAVYPIPPLYGSSEIVDLDGTMHPSAKDRLWMAAARRRTPSECGAQGSMTGWTLPATNLKLWQD